MYAGMAELADALDLGSSGNPVQVQVLLPAPKAFHPWVERFLLIFAWHLPIAVMCGRITE